MNFACFLSENKISQEDWDISSEELTDEIIIIQADGGKLAVGPYSFIWAGPSSTIGGDRNGLGAEPWGDDARDYARIVMSAGIYWPDGWAAKSPPWAVEAGQYAALIHCAEATFAADRLPIAAAEMGDGESGKLLVFPDGSAYYASGGCHKVFNHWEEPPEFLQATQSSAR